MIDGVIIKDLVRNEDKRGWLAELWREDQLPNHLPAMSYISVTNPGMTRGPHEHIYQTDMFFFVSGSFHLWLWDNRENSPTKGNSEVIQTHWYNMKMVIVPPGVVHAYKSMSNLGIVINCPNMLYKGTNKEYPVDEIRHEDGGDPKYKEEMLAYYEQAV